LFFSANANEIFYSYEKEKIVIKVKDFLWSDAKEKNFFRARPAYYQ